MTTFATPEPITATLTTAGARVRVAATDRSDTVVLVEPINRASRSDVKVAEHTKVDFADGSALSTEDDPAEFDNKVTLYARTRLDDIVIHRAAG